MTFNLTTYKARLQLAFNDFHSPEATAARAAEAAKIEALRAKARRRRFHPTRKTPNAEKSPRRPS